MPDGPAVDNFPAESNAVALIIPTYKLQPSTNIPPLDFLNTPRTRSNIPHASFNNNIPPNNLNIPHARFNMNTPPTNSNGVALIIPTYKLQASSNTPPADLLATPHTNFNTPYASFNTPQVTPSTANASFHILTGSNLHPQCSSSFKISSTGHAASEPLAHDDLSMIYDVGTWPSSTGRNDSIDSGYATTSHLDPFEEALPRTTGNDTQSLRSPAESASSPQKNLWQINNANLLSSFDPSKRALIARENLTTNVDLLIRAKLYGWDSISPFFEQYPSLPIVRFMEESVFSSLPIVSKLAILVVATILIQFNCNPSPLRRMMLPDWYQKR
jgi:hypothetical protein